MSNANGARFALGLAAGIGVAYTLVRTGDALRDRAMPTPARERDAKRYGETRRILTLAGIARAGYDLPHAFHSLHLKVPSLRKDLLALLAAVPKG